MKKTNNNQIQQWRELYAKKLSALEGKEICSNLTNFVSIINKWNKKKGGKNEV
ncbi:MAG: hypothetical protein GY853_14745 [PVC group bacterium]|nr:hypothetical protein [PVC group bacterium]